MPGFKWDADKILVGRDAARRAAALEAIARPRDRGHIASVIEGCRQELARARAAMRRRKLASRPSADPAYEAPRGAHEKADVRVYQTPALAAPTPQPQRRPARFTPARAAFASAMAAISLFGIAHAISPEASDRALGSVMATVFPATITRRIDEARACSARAPIWFGDGSPAGYFRAANCAAEETYRSAAVTPADAKRAIAYFVAAEGEIDGPFVVLGVNLKGIGRVFLSVASRLLGAKAERLGGSSPVQTAVEVAVGRTESLSALDKMGFMVSAVVYSSQRLRTAADRDVFVVENMLCARGEPHGDAEFGAPIAGALCAQIFNKVNYFALTPAELCVIAAAAKLQIRIVGPTADSAAVKHARSVNESIRARAITRCADVLLAQGALSNAQHRELVAAIKALRFPRFVQNPDRLLSERAPGVELALGDADRLGEASSGTLSVTATAQALLRKTVEQVLNQEVSPGLAPTLCWNPRCAPEQTQVDVLVAVAELTGGRFALRALYANRHELMTGPIVNGARGRPTRSLGSINKGLFSPLVGAFWKRDALVCRRAHGDLHDPGGALGTNCSAPSDFEQLESIFARSTNTSFYEALSKPPPDALRRYLDAAGFVYDRNASDEDLLLAATLGTAVIATPEVAMRDFAVIAFADGQAVGLPELVWRNEALNALEIDDLDVGDTARQRARFWLRAPIRRADGTLHSLDAMLAALGCTMHHGKTGTTDSGAATDAARDRLGIVATTCGGRRFVAFALIGSPDPGQALGLVPSHAIARVLAGAVESGLKATPNDQVYGEKFADVH